MSDFISSVAAFIVIMGVAFGLSYWAFRAQSDNSARVGIYIVFGFPGLLLTIAGLALAVNGIEAGPIVLASGLGLMLPLVKGFRVWLATVTPIDPASPIDMMGLCLILGLIGFLATSIVNASPSSGGGDSVSVAYLLVQVLAEVGLALAAIGWWFRRTIQQAICRLGLVRPTGRTVAIALGCTILAFILNGFASYLTEWFQPHVYDEVQKATRDISANVQNPIGAVILGLSAGIGEELLLRGAIQPRIGIVLTSVLFALLHTQYGFSLVVVGLFATGIMLGLERKYYGTTTAIITHVLFDTIVVLAQTTS